MNPFTVINHIAASRKPGKKHRLARIFSSALLAAAVFLAPAAADARDILGTRIAFATAWTEAVQKKLLRGHNDSAFTQISLLKAQMTIFRAETPLIKRLGSVNSFWNQFKYKTDESLYHESDHWATPGEFLKNKGGDCEDFALVKYWTLRELGVPAEKMIILVGELIKDKRSHALLAVEDETGQVWLLDKLSNKIFAENEMYLEFVPRFVVSETQKCVCLCNDKLKTDLGRDPFQEKTNQTAVLRMARIRIEKQANSNP